jgi:uncharacterized protein (DUF488 family)
MDEKADLFTLGHSTRTFDEFLEILKAYGIEHLVDVRTIPRSRRHPHFSQESLVGSLPEAGIQYTHMKELGDSASLCQIHLTAPGATNPSAVMQTICRQKLSRLRWSA